MRSDKAQDEVTWGEEIDKPGVTLDLITELLNCLCLQVNKTGFRLQRPTQPRKQTSAQEGFQQSTSIFWEGLHDEWRRRFYLNTGDLRLKIQSEVITNTLVNFHLEKHGVIVTFQMCCYNDFTVIPWWLHYFNFLFNKTFPLSRLISE